MLAKKLGDRKAWAQGFSEQVKVLRVVKRYLASHLPGGTVIDSWCTSLYARKFSCTEAGFIGQR